MERVKAIDAARGMLILYIVCILHGLFYLNLIPVALSSLLLFEMPMLFIVSGYSYYLYEKSRNRNRTGLLTAKQYASFLISRLARILGPYFLYAAFCIIVVYAISISGNPGYSLVELAGSWLNPVTGGSQHSIGMLNWHLWFIPVFLIVTAAMPFVTRLEPSKNLHPLIWVLGIAGIEYILTAMHFPEEKIVKQTLFYLIFSCLGYHMAKHAEYFRRINYFLVGMTCLILLAVSATLARDTRILNMQVNKFPPNYLFFLFSCMWASVFLFLCFRVPILATRLEQSADAAWLRPFISAGYSIYLWQGVGYTTAVYAGKKLNLALGAVWLLALVLSVGLGGLASPVERWRIKR